MECPRMHDLLSAYLDGELSAEEQTLVHRHLAECSSCRALVDELESVSALVRSAFAELSAPVDTEERVAERLTSLRRKNQRRRATSVAVSGAVAAGFAAAGGLIVLRPFCRASFGLARYAVHSIRKLFLTWLALQQDALVGFASVGVAVAVLAALGIRRILKPTLHPKWSGSARS